MRYCGKCGTHVNEGDVFCNTCGSNVSESAPLPPQPALMDPAPVPPPTTPVISATPKPASSAGKILWYVIFGILVIALIAFGVVYSQTSGKLTSAKSQVATLENKVTELQGNIDSLNAQLTTETANSTSLQTQLTVAQANITRLTSDLNTAQASLTTAEGQIKTIQASLDTANASVTKLSADVTTANSKITITQASLDKANADLTIATTSLTKATADLTKANADLASANANLDKITAPRNFYSLDELKAWLLKDDTNTKYSSSRPIERALILQIRATRDGFLLPVTSYIVNSTSYTSFNIAIIGTTIYSVLSSDDTVAVYIDGIQPIASQPLPLNQ